MMRIWIMGLLVAASSALASQRPNILFPFADDLGRYASVYADPDHPSPDDIIRTPAFDRIAAEGAVFRNGSSSQLHSP